MTTTDMTRAVALCRAFAAHLALFRGEVNPAGGAPLACELETCAAFDAFCAACAKRLGVPLDALSAATDAPRYWLVTEEADSETYTFPTAAADEAGALANYRAAFPPHPDYNASPDYEAPRVQEISAEE